MILAKFILILFGIFFIWVGILMLIKPHSAINILRKAGSTNFINYGEITIRLIPALSMIIYADSSKYPLPFTIFGGFMLVTSVILYFVPRKLHHSFSLKSAEILKPVYFQLISPFSILIGIAIIYNVVEKS